MSYKAEVRTRGESRFSTNAIAFATETEAEQYAADLARRWTLVEEYRVVESDQPVNYELVDGVVRSLERGTVVRTVNA